MGTPVIAGRDFTSDDRRGTRPVVIVNETWARTFVNGANPLGHTVTVVSPYSGTSMDVVGVVADAVFMWLREPAPPTMYSTVRPAMPARAAWDRSIWSCIPALVRRRCWPGALHRLSCG